MMDSIRVGVGTSRDRYRSLMNGYVQSLQLTCHAISAVAIPLFSPPIPDTFSKHG